jgi:Domain of unknown function (DUF397)
MEITDMNWRKSSYSGGNGGSCIEVASDGAVMVRDTTDRTGPMLQFTSDAWRRFAEQVKRSLALDAADSLRRGTLASGPGSAGMRPGTWVEIPLIGGATAHDRRFVGFCWTGHVVTVTKCGAEPRFCP